MRLFRKYRSSSRRKNAGNKKTAGANNNNDNDANDDTSSSNTTKQIPPQLLFAVLSFVCPHALDESYNSSEEHSTSISNSHSVHDIVVGDGLQSRCGLCDMRDLAQCALVNKAWCKVVQTLLYRHVRIDAVHYCELEIELSSKRKRHRSFIHRDVKELDVSQTRLELFMRTVRESQKLADIVLSLRLPYMTREASKSDLARTVSVLRHLRYVDLPVGAFSDEPASYTLKQELMAKCPDIRRMAYRHGSEMSFSQIIGAKLWTNLESLELSGLQVDEGTLRQVLASFPALRSLQMEKLASIGDSVFTPSQFLPNFPAIARLVIRNMASITANGLATNLSSPQNRHGLDTLSLTQTGVRPESLHEILSRAPRLKSLTFELDVETSFPAHEIPPLTSASVETIRYEIASTSSPSGMQTVANSYYDYLISSLNSNSLPALRFLYVLDSRIIDILRLAPPLRLVGGSEGMTRPPSLKPGLQQPLTLYTKSVDEFEWNMTRYDPTSSGRPTSVTSPASLHSAQLSPRWGGQARQSVLVGNGFGGYLAVPVDEEGPTNSGEKFANKRDSKFNLWR